jgi:uncharacterized protein GlcG (DUF336 family)
MAGTPSWQQEDSMRVRAASVLAFLGLASVAATAVAAQRVPEQFTISGAAAGRLDDYISINSATAERLAQSCFEIIRREANADSATIVILNPYGLVVHQHSKDGQRYTSIKITENKARTALLYRLPTVDISRDLVDDPQQLFRYDQIGLQATQPGGVPIVVNGQMIGAMGIGGFAGGEKYHTIATMCLESIFGKQS